MQSKLTLLAFAGIATAAALSNRDGGSQCSTGPVQCCNSVTKASDPSTAEILKSLGIVVQDVDALVGVTCSPIDVIGGGGSTCSAQTVCCEDNYAHGIVAVNCVIIDI